MKSIIFLVLSILLVSSVSAFFIPADRLGPSDAWNVQSPSSQLREWHHEMQKGVAVPAIRVWGGAREYTGINRVKVFKIANRVDSEGYTAVYGVERNVIVPWQLFRTMR